MFLSTFARTGRRRLKAASAEVRQSPLLLLLAPLFSSCCRENGIKEETSFHTECSGWFPERSRRSEFTKFLKWGCVVPRKRILIVSNSNPPPRGRDISLCLPYIFFVTFFVTLVCLRWFSCGPCLLVSICQCEHLSCEMHSVDKMSFYFLTAPGVLARWLQINSF